MASDALPHERAWALALLASVWSLTLLGCGDNATPAPTYEPYEAGELAPLECVPDLDGKLTAQELREALNIPVTYLVSPFGQTRQVDLAGQINSAGLRRWDWSAPTSQDQVARLEAQALQGKWYAQSFPSGQFVVPSDLAASLEGVYRRDDDGFYLLGLASSQADPPEGRTLLVYDQPIALFRFPLELGKSWVSVGQVRDARVRGLPYAGKDTYEVKVEAIGQLRLTDLTFDQALQVRTQLTLEPAIGQSIRRQQVSFMVECFGEVARATSRDDEPDALFKQAVELRRLGIAP